MQYIVTHRFKKSFSKLSIGIKTKAKKQIFIFLNNPTDTILNNHALHDKWSNYRSINITGNIRIIYKLEDKNIARFIDIGTHSKLYS